MGYKILVTGCAGYIGSILVGKLLEEGCHVIGVDNLMFSNASALLNYLGYPRFEFHKLDVQDYLPLSRLAKQADIVIPLAALVGAPLCDKHPETAVAVNHWALADLVRGLSPRQRVCFPNTNSGYGSSGSEAAVTEEYPLKPISLYGRTKCEAEKVVLDHPNSVVLRLATVFGASPRMRMDLLLNFFTERLYRMRKAGWENTPFQIYEPHFRRNFVGVQDAARAFLYVASRYYLTGVYNLGAPSGNVTKRELAGLVCDTLQIPRSYFQEGAGHDPDQRDYAVSSRKIMDAGFEFRHGLPAGIREVAQLCDLFSGAETAKMRNAA